MNEYQYFQQFVGDSKTNPDYADFAPYSIDDLPHFRTLWMPPWFVITHDGKYYLRWNTPFDDKHEGTFETWIKNINGVLTVSRNAGKDYHAVPFNIADFFEVQIEQ